MPSQEEKEAVAALVCVEDSTKCFVGRVVQWHPRESLELAVPRYSGDESPVTVIFTTDESLERGLWRHPETGVIYRHDPDFSGPYYMLTKAAWESQFNA